MTGEDLLNKLLALSPEDRKKKVIMDDDGCDFEVRSLFVHSSDLEISRDEEDYA